MGQVYRRNTRQRNGIQNYENLNTKDMVSDLKQKYEVRINVMWLTKTNNVSIDVFLLKILS